jgi:hypothetical protein
VWPGKTGVLPAAEVRRHEAEISFQTKQFDTQEPRGHFAHDHDAVCQATVVIWNDEDVGWIENDPRRYPGASRPTRQ